MAKPENEVKISKAKGRPMLTWVGKRPLERVTAYPAQHVESFSAGDVPVNPDVDWSDWPEKFPRGGLLFHGDNKDVLAHLLANGFRGKVKLIYIDPPFDSGADYVRKVELRGKGGDKLSGEEYGLGEQIQYTDIWANDNYLQFIYERLFLLKELLSEDGSIYLHCDDRKNHHLRCLMDEVFGGGNFRSEIIREKCNPKNYTSAGFGNIHDSVLFYSKSDSPVWSRLYTSFDDDSIVDSFPKVDPSGRRYKTAPLHAAGVRSGETGKAWRGIPPPPGNHWRYIHKTLDELDAAGLIEWSDSGNPRKIIFGDESKGIPVQDLWLKMKDGGGEYPTQKNPALIQRIVSASTNEGDLVLDSFVGSGTTALVAQRMGRRWIGCDINKGAIQTAAKRLQNLMREQLETEREKQSSLVLDDTNEPACAQLAFSTWRINDYDLQVQHNEAVELACEHIGVVRTRSDSYFDGRLGERLVKIVPFNHPLSPLDLEDIDQELKRRPEEQRDVMVVCLGMELAARAWVEQHNANRPINRYHVVELRTDRKYGGFIKHEPLSAVVEAKRVGERLKVEITDVFSPTIMQRLNMEEGIFRAHIDDWRSVVDCVMIDPRHDGEVFNVALSDVPARKQDLVQGSYDLPAPPPGAVVAVKVIDMLGEEVVVTTKV